MRIQVILAVCLLGVGSVAACGGGGGSDGMGGMGGADSDESGGAGSGGDSTGSGGGSSTGGLSGGEVEYFDLTGRIRFANFISDGEAGVDVDVYWGGTPARGELVDTVPYGTITEFMVPRRAEDSIFDENEANYFFLPVGSVDSGEIYITGDEVFTEDTQLTVALAAAEPVASLPGLRVSSTTFFEHEISTPPAGAAHVYGWDNPWDPIEGFNFALVGADDSCDPEQGEVTGGNLGVPSVIPEGTTGVTLFDANTECSAGGPVPEGEIEAGHSYVLLGVAEAYDLEEREVILLEVGAE